MATNFARSYPVFKDFHTLENNFGQENCSKYVVNCAETIDNVSVADRNSSISEQNKLEFTPGKDFQKYSELGLALIVECVGELLGSIYVNVVINEKIFKPHFKKDVDNKIELWNIPHIIAPIREECINGSLYSSGLNLPSKNIDILDIIVNPFCLQEIRYNDLLCNSFVHFITMTLSKTLEIETKPGKILGFDLYIGNTMSAENETKIILFHNNIYNFIELQKVGNIAIKRYNENEIPIEKLIDINDDKKVACYTIKYLYENSILEESETRNRPSIISLEFFLPGIYCIDDIDIETDGKEIKVRTYNNLTLDINMDFPVLKNPVKSIFFKDKNILNLEMKINETGFSKINLGQTTIKNLNNECYQKEQPEDNVPHIDSEELIYILPDYKVTQSMTEYTLTVNSNGMIKGSLKHFYVSNDALEVVYDKNIQSSTPIKCRIIFDVSPRKLNCANSYLNQSKKSLIFTIKKFIPKISIKAKIGCSYDSLEEIKVLYYERKYSKKKGKQSECIRECPERTRSLSESCAYDCVDEEERSMINGRSRLKQNSFSNGSQRGRSKSEYFLTSSWPKGILKRSHSNSESAYALSQDNIIGDDEYSKESGRFASKLSLGSSNSLYDATSSDSNCYLSGLESSLEDLSLESSSPNKRVVFSGIIMKEIYKASTSILGAKNKRDYIKKRQKLKGKVKKGNSQAQKELKLLDQTYKNSNSVHDETIDFKRFNRATDNKIAKKSIKKKNGSLKNLDKEDLIFSFEEDH